jgi:hypothetical protein
VGKERCGVDGRFAVEACDVRPEIELVWVAVLERMGNDVRREEYGRRSLSWR